MCTRLIVILSLSGLVPASPAAAQLTPQPPGAVGVVEATAITQGWALLAQGLLDASLAHAEAALRQYPRNPSALSLAVEVWIARFGAIGALDRYEAFVGRPAFEPAHVARRIAHATLWEIARQSETGHRAEALKYLVADGDSDAANELSAGLDAGRPSDLLAMASLGSDVAVSRLLATVQTAVPGRPTMLKAIGQSGQRQAIPVVTALLDDMRDEVKIAAAEALADLSAREAVPSLRRLLEGQTMAVRLAAAASLYRLDDFSGYPFIQQILFSDIPSVRIGAAQAIAAKPDAAWMEVVRALMAAEDPVVRLQAAELLAPHDPAAARGVADALGNSDNVALREAAAQLVAGAAGTDLPTLRALLRRQDPVVRLRAAGRLLALTRSGG